MNSAGVKKKLGGVIYLRQYSALNSHEIIGNFEKQWPKVGIKDEGQQQGLMFFSIAHAWYTVELCKTQIPGSVTAEALRPNLQWRDADQQLRGHASHITVSAMAAPSDGIEIACNLTRLVSTLMGLSDAIGACWLNGPVLCPKQSFIDISAECFTAGILPSLLWIADRWEPQTGLIYTTGMDQFERPDLFLAEQQQQTNVEYLFDLVNYILSSGKEILDGETVDGPDGTLRVQTLERSYKTGKSGLMFIPVRVG